ncbi:MAG: AMP-binding protein, partial [Deltaproteobacteria bacterium]|nr:AMP-binding protein [Deltaproteobacteria bacterium]
MPLELAPRAVVARRAGDAWYLASPQPLIESPDRLFDLVRRAAAGAPDRDFLVERRADGSLRRVTWAEALAFATGIAEWLIAAHPADARVMALSGNSIDHALLMLGCFAAGVPFVPVSPAYALLSQDFAKLRVVVEKVAPAVVFVEAEAPYRRALDALALDAELVIGDALAARVRTGDRLAAREAAVTVDHVAKILFTSGSTAFPKGVPNTHGMLCANQQMIAQCWPFLAADEPPVLVDWLPWSHTFGGNHNFNLVLRHAGTLLIDEGRPTPVGIDATLRNLAALSPTLYFNVPAGYAALVPRLEADAALARAFFARLRVMFYAAAALPPDLWQRLTALARASTDREVFMTTAWGSTETSPMATSTHFAVPAAGNIGLPAPGVTLKLVPSGAKLEVRVKGPSVMRGYLDEPALTAAAFDDEGFYRIGDAVRFADPDRPEAGLCFDGRIAEDFKLASGTWVSVTTIRTGVVAAAGGALADVVVCGHDRAQLAVLA